MKHYIVQTDDGMGVGILGGCVGFGTPNKINSREMAEELAEYCRKFFGWNFIVVEEN